MIVIPEVDGIEAVVEPPVHFGEAVTDLRAVAVVVKFFAAVVEAVAEFLDVVVVEIIQVRDEDLLFLFVDLE